MREPADQNDPGRLPAAEDPPGEPLNLDPKDEHNRALLGAGAHPEPFGEDDPGPHAILDALAADDPTGPDNGDPFEEFPRPDPNAPSRDPDFDDPLPPLLNRGDASLGDRDAPFPERLFRRTDGGPEPGLRGRRDWFDEGDDAAGPGERRREWPREPAFGGRAGPILIAAGIMAFAMIFIGWAGNQRRLEAQQEWRALPQITDDDPYRIAPEPQTPAPTPFANNTVYDQLDGGASAVGGGSSSITGAPVASDSPARAAEPSSGNGGAITVPETATPPASAAKPPSSATESPPSGRIIAGAGAEDTTSPNADLPPAFHAPRVPPRDTANAAPLDPSRRFMVQISSARSREDAEREWVRLSRANRALFDGVPREIKEADLGERGVYFRLRVGPFAQLSGAREFCERYRQSGGQCWWLITQ